SMKVLYAVLPASGLPLAEYHLYSRAFSNIQEICLFYLHNGVEDRAAWYPIENRHSSFYHPLYIVNSVGILCFKINNQYMHRQLIMLASNFYCHIEHYTAVSSSAE